MENTPITQIKIPTGIKIIAIVYALFFLWIGGTIIWLDGLFTEYRWYEIPGNIVAVFISVLGIICCIGLFWRLRWARIILMIIQIVITGFLLKTFFDYLDAVRAITFIVVICSLYYLSGDNKVREVFTKKA